LSTKKLTKLRNSICCFCHSDTRLRRSSSVQQANFLTRFTPNEIHPHLPKIDRQSMPAKKRFFRLIRVAEELEIATVEPAHGLTALVRIFFSDKIARIRLRRPSQSRLARSEAQMCENP
jgi:hypothetical protein